jgi:hypothetical protein
MVKSLALGVILVGAGRDVVGIRAAQSPGN